jgi:hypothetical protein
MFLCGLGGMLNSTLRRASRGGGHVNKEAPPPQFAAKAGNLRQRFKGFSAKPFEN